MTYFTFMEHLYRTNIPRWERLTGQPSLSLEAGPLGACYPSRLDRWVQNICVTKSPFDSSGSLLLRRWSQQHPERDEMLCLVEIQWSYWHAKLREGGYWDAPPGRAHGPFQIWKGNGIDVKVDEKNALNWYLSLVLLYFRNRHPTNCHDTFRRAQFRLHWKKTFTFPLMAVSLSLSHQLIAQERLN